MSKKFIPAILVATPLSILITYFLFGTSTTFQTSKFNVKTDLVSKTKNSQDSFVESSKKSTHFVIRKDKKTNRVNNKTRKTQKNAIKTKNKETNLLANSFNTLPSIFSDVPSPQSEDALKDYPAVNGERHLGFVDPKLIKKFDPSTLENFKYVEGELLVGIKPDFDEEIIRQALGNVEVKPFAKLPGTYHVKLSKNASLTAAITQLNENRAFEYAEPNFLKEVTATPDDSYFSSQYSHSVAKAVSAWDTSTGSSSVVVAVIDTGVQTGHPDLSPNIYVNAAEASGTPGVDDDGNGYIDDISGWDFFYGDPIPNDAAGHGTHCAGIIGAKGDNGIGVAGVCWDVKILPCRIGGTGGLSISAAIEAVVYASDIGADVLSNSWGGPGYSSSLASAISYANSKGVLFVAASGNDSKNNDVSPSYPCNYTVANVISVGSSTSSDGRSSFSNYGSSTVDLFAPGSSILSTYPTSTLTSLSGTSMACPYVSGTLALLLSVDSSLSVTDAKSILMATVDVKSAFTGKCVSGGRVNVEAMLAAVASDPDPDPDPEPDPTPSGPLALLGTGAGGTNTLLGVDLAGGSTTLSVFGSGNVEGEVLCAGGDVHSTSGLEIIVAHGTSGSSKIKVMSADGTVLKVFTAFGTGGNPSGKVNICVEDVISSNPGAEIICGTGPGGASRVKIFSGTGALLSTMDYAGNASGELFVTAGDLTSSPGKEIVVGTGIGGPSKVAFFSATGSFLFASGSLSTSGAAIPVAVGDVTSHSGLEIAYTLANKIYVYSFAVGGYVASFTAFSSSENPSGLVHIAIGDVSTSVARSEIYVGTGPDGSSKARLFSGSGSLAAEGTIFSSNPGGEVHVGVMD